MLSAEELEIFRRDGVIVVRKLLQGDELKEAQEVAENVSTKIGRFGTATYQNIEFYNWKSTPPLKHVALHSKAPQIASQLIHSNSSDGNQCPIRLLKDAVLCFGPKSTGCGWHVDDKGFWPCYDDTTGINVWIALSEISSATGGGLAIAPGSHKLEWNRQAASIIHENFGTCNMETLAPDYHSILESMKVVYDMQPGDAIIHDRWLYHRADPFKKINSYISTSSGSNSSGVDTSATATVSETGYLNRYSIRYMPETARAYNVGLMKPEYTEIHFRDSKYTTFDGHPLSDFGTDYFPQVYPTVIIG